MPGAMLIQIIVLAPIALWCVYELGARVGGRVVGYVAAVVWTLARTSQYPCSSTGITTVTSTSFSPFRSG